ncbi:MAG TPA: extracellular solute-binding protein [Alphaproteobacteria bacterium]|nr:extracellular solute-binding protein [Alphaproteobacteria bacterium]
MKARFVSKIKKAQLFVISLLALSFLFFINTYFFSASPKTSLEEESVVNVYNFYGMIPKDVLHDFEKETGIKVRYDLYDNNEILEAKLLASNSGYDVVFPSALPYAHRQIQASVYQALQKDLIPNLKNLDPHLSKELKKVDPHQTYIVPFYWGALGFVINAKEVKKLAPNVDLTTFSLLFDPKNLSKVQKCGVTFLEEAVDVYPIVLGFLGLNPDSLKEADIQKAQERLYELRPYLKGFSSSRYINQLIMKDTCVAQAYSGEAQMVQQQAMLIYEENPQGEAPEFAFIIPKNSRLWFDVIAIPTGAPHPKNAHTFINFLLRPDISTRISIYSNLPTTNAISWKQLEKNKEFFDLVFPPKEILDTLVLDEPQEETFVRKMNKLWTLIRLNLRKD